MRKILTALAATTTLALGILPAAAQTAETAGGAQPPAAPPAFGIHGSNTIGAELMPRIIEEFAFASGGSATRESGEVAEETTWTVRAADGRPAVVVALESHGSGTSFPGIASGAAEIGMSSRPIKASEEEALAARGITGMRSPDQQHIVALDGLLVLVSPENPVQSLPLETIARIFAGEITDWAEVGGNPGPIALHARDDKSGTYDTFESLVLDPFGVALSETAARYESNALLSDTVANDPNAIGFGGFAFLRNAKALAIGSACGMISTPSTFNVKTEEYPLSRRLFLYTGPTSEMSGEARALLEFALSDDAQAAVLDVGFIDQTVDTLDFDAQGRRIAMAQLQPAVDTDARLMAEALGELMLASRLSTTFRFETGSTELDSKGRTDIRRVARRLAQPDMASREVMVVGFTDSVGAFASNRRLAERRAESIVEALRAAEPAMAAKEIRTVAYAELMPIACNTTETGRAKNRRVEIWVR